MLPSRDYDQAITIFSPEGRLYQVEYALELVNRGAPISGVMSKEGVAFAANETVESILQDPLYSRKIFQFDNHVAACIVGLSSDARVLVEKGRIRCQQNKLLYNEPLDIEVLGRAISDEAQVYTQYAGVRPFGVSMIIGGVDTTGGRLLTTDPSGSYRGYVAVSLGRKSDDGNKALDQKYRDDMSLGEALELAVEVVKLAAEGDISAKTIKGALIPSDTKTFTKVPDEEITRILSKTQNQ